MPITYVRDDQRRLITLTATAPYSVGDILSMIDRQAAEDTWGYAMLYDLRAVTLASEVDVERMAARVQVLGDRRQRGPVGIAVASVSEQFRMGMVYSKLTKDLEIVEVLLTASQRDDWLARNARRGSSGQS